MVNIHQLLFQHFAAGFNVAEGQIRVEELPCLHLLVDDVVHQVADFLFVRFLDAVRCGLDAVGHHQDGGLS